MNIASLNPELVFCDHMQARTQLFRRGVHFKLEWTSCQQS